MLLSELRDLFSCRGKSGDVHTQAELRRRPKRWRWEPAAQTGNRVVSSLNFAAAETAWVIPASFCLVTKHHTHVYSQISPGLMVRNGTVG